MTHEIVYQPKLGELHWYGCDVIRRLPVYTPKRIVSPDEVTCSVCRILVGSPSWD